MEISAENSTLEPTDDADDPLCDLIKPELVDFDVKERVKSKSKRVKAVKKKIYAYKDGKRKPRRSGSESSDYEKYTYFDERRARRKIKIDPDLSNDQLAKLIRMIQVDNECLEAERRRVEEIKLKERLKIRLEIKRLKQFIINLRLGSKFKDHAALDAGNTTSLIRVLKEQLDVVDYSRELTDDDGTLLESLKHAPFTDDRFWTDLNSTENGSEEISARPLWIGRLDDIEPDAEDYFKPDDYVRSFIGHKPPHEADRTFVQPSDDSSVSSECDDYNEDWNKLATKRKIKKIKLEPVDDTNNVQNHSEHSNDSNRFDSDIQIKYETIGNHSDDLCIGCGLGASWESFVARHREAYQRDEKLPPCNACNMKFLKSGHFDGRHRLKRPPPKKYRPQLFTCDICGQGCTSRSGLNQHRFKHEEARFSCPICLYKCRRKGYMKKHIAGHDRIKNVYNKKTTAKSTEDGVHIRTQRTDRLKNLLCKRTPNKNRFQCKICNFKCSKVLDLRAHTNRHKSALQCSRCDFTAVTEAKMKMHIKRLHGDLPDCSDGPGCSDPSNTAK